ncbi:hypothetical protein THOM_1428 [Trachipleistophora hominis]|uniref:Uncharacterized protein n=1 Tax=Trachipleistophora hominis TaxID=72359 RepID=L7JXY9_TRAHO|nr:hypothetical protein THOM_1428 [Trachipleistophora hominis]
MTNNNMLDVGQVGNAYGDDHHTDELEQNDDQNVNINMTSNEDDYGYEDYPEFATYTVKTPKPFCDTCNHDSISGWLIKRGKNTSDCYISAKPAKKTTYSISDATADCNISSPLQYTCDLGFTYGPMEFNTVGGEIVPKHSIFKLKCEEQPGIGYYNIKCERDSPQFNSSSKLRTKVRATCPESPNATDRYCSFEDKTDDSSLIKLGDVILHYDQLNEDEKFFYGFVQHENVASNVPTTTHLASISEPAYNSLDASSPTGAERISVTRRDLMEKCMIAGPVFVIFAIFIFIYWYFWKRPRKSRLNFKRHTEWKRLRDTDGKEI